MRPSYLFHAFKLKDNHISAAVFISEITSRAFIQADSCKRRTLSQQDIVRALTKSDQFDFLIDIVPREEPLGQAGDAAPSKKKSAQQQASAAAAAAATARGTEADNGEVRAVAFTHMNIWLTSPTLPRVLLLDLRPGAACSRAPVWHIHACPGQLP